MKQRGASTPRDWRQRSKADLDAKYAQFEAQLRMKERPPSSGTIKMLIDEKKKADRYGEAS